MNLHEGRAAAGGLLPTWMFPENQNRKFRSSRSGDSWK
jgi:hypothetical protein